MTTKASDYQIGGEHYKSEYQHWDWCIDINLNYLESAATKYVTRWNKKNGVQDVEKAIHYLTKAREAHREGRFDNQCWVVSPLPSVAKICVEHTRSFCHANKLSLLEENFMLSVAGWQNEGDLVVVIGLAEQILGMAKEAAEARNSTTATPTPNRATGGAQPPNLGQAGRAGGATTQGTGNSASVGVASKGVEGQKHPFGYDAEQEGYGERPECDFTNHKEKQ